MKLVTYQSREEFVRHHDSARRGGSGGGSQQGKQNEDKKSLFKVSRLYIYHAYKAPSTVVSSQRTGRLVLELYLMCIVVGECRVIYS